MGEHDKIPIISEKKVIYSEIYDIKEEYKYLKEFLENSRHYDITEKDYEEKNDKGDRSIVVKCEAEQEFTDYYKIIIKFGLKMNGKDISIQTPEGKNLNRTEGKANISVNAYILADWQNKRGQSPLSKFLDKVYSKYVGGDEMDRCIGSAVGDVNEILGRFKQQMNTTM